MKVDRDLSVTDKADILWDVAGDLREALRHLFTAVYTVPSNGGLDVELSVIRVIIGGLEDIEKSLRSRYGELCESEEYQEAKKELDEFHLLLQMDRLRESNLIVGGELEKHVKAYFAALGEE